MTSIYDGSSASALLTGLMWKAAYQECAQAEYTGIALEYGTAADARGDRCAARRPVAGEPPRGAAPRSARRSSGSMRDAFYTDTEAWKPRIVEQGVEAAYQAVAGLGA